jgi:hypothetical protein
MMVAGSFGGWIIWWCGDLPANLDGLASICICFDMRQDCH